MDEEIRDMIDEPENLELEGTKLTNGVYRVVDEEKGYVVYYGVFDGEVNSVDAEPIRDD